MTKIESIRTGPQQGEASGYDKCMLRDAGAVRAQLQKLVDQRSLLTVSGNSGSVSVRTVVLAVEETTLLLDVPSSKLVLDRMLRCSRLSFDGLVNRITLHFTSGPPALGTHQGCAALVLPLPERLLYLQRRELMRREPPTDTLHCLIPRPDRPHDAPTVTATIREIGGGGLAVVAPEEELELTPGDVLHGCLIDLAQLGVVEVKLGVRHVFSVIRHGKESRQAGCEFLDLTAAVQAKLFRYLMQLDRDQLANRRGMAGD